MITRSLYLYYILWASWLYGHGWAHAILVKPSTGKLSSQSSYLLDSNSSSYLDPIDTPSRRTRKGPYATSLRWAFIAQTLGFGVTNPRMNTVLY
jgi:hypothetical protein